jgi:hypothetical protein
MAAGSDCTTVPCATGYSCDGNPPACRECVGLGPQPEGGVCSCNADCDAGLDCNGGFCSRSCRIDEMCGADECHHDIASPASCLPVDPTCTASGSTAMGQPCVCNADCGPIALYCLSYIAGGMGRSVCSTTCGAEVPCPSGFTCCSVGGNDPSCVAPDVATMLGATCL